MADARAPRVLSERQGKWLVSLYPPLLFQRVKVVRFGDGFRSCEVRVARSLLTRNLNGTTFGGSIFAAADPIYAIMYWQALARRGLRVQSWLKSARIDYRRPVATALSLHFRLDEEQVDRAERGLAETGRYECRHSTLAVDRHDRVCAEVETDVHVRLPRGKQKEVSGF